MLRADYFTATWCGPCKAFKPVFFKVADEMGIEVRVFDADEDPEVFSQHGIQSVPTVLVYDPDTNKDGIVVNGAFPESRLRERLASIIA